MKHIAEYFEPVFHHGPIFDKSGGHTTGGECAPFATVRPIIRSDTPLSFFVGHGTKLRRIPSQLLCRPGQRCVSLSLLVAELNLFSTGKSFNLAWDTRDSGTRGVKYINYNNKVSHQSVPF